MTPTKTSIEGEWDGVERRADGGNPSRVAIIFASKPPGTPPRYPIAQEAGGTDREPPPPPPYIAA